MVDEQEKPTQKAAEAPAENTKEGDVVSTDSLIERADALNKGLKETEARIKEHVDKFEKIAARALLSGRAEAGAPQKTQEEIDKEEIEKQALEIANRLRMPTK